MFVHANSRKKTGVALIIPDQVDFKTRRISGGNKGHFIKIKRSIHYKI